MKDSQGSLSDGPYAETKDIVIGFAVIEANNLEHAVALATGDPIDEQGGVVEVRPIPKM